MQELYNRYLTTHFDAVQQYRDWETLLEIMHHLYSAHLPLNRQASILEIGCGKGDFLKFLLHEKYENFLGVDIGQEQIEYCSQNITHKVLLIEDISQFLANHPNEFDVVVMLDVLEHIPNSHLLAIVKQIQQSLRFQGKLIAKTINAANPIAAQLIFGSDLSHQFIFSETSLTQLCRISGFSRVDFYSDNLPSKGVKRRIRSLARMLLYKWYQIEYYLNYNSLPHQILTPDIIMIAQKQTLISDAKK